MKSNLIRLLFTSYVTILSLTVLAQTSVSGTITDGETSEALIGVNILVQGTVLGTITDVNGNFNLNISSDPPLTLIVSSVGFIRQEIAISNSSTSGLNISMVESALLGQEVVVSASRIEESIMQSPVSIEKMDIVALQNNSSDDYYKSIMNLKGVDMTSSSINFQIINARGFSSTGNTRFVQLVDGMDTQAPALNFPIGNLNGPSVLDVESVELLPGAASALYGPNAFNGVILVTSKNPFDYQGISAYTKMGVNHVGSEANQDMAPLFETSIRAAKAWNNKIAAKVNVTYSKASDWHGRFFDDRNEAINPLTSVGGENPGMDLPHYMGDEAALNISILRFSDSDESGVGYQTAGSIGSGIYAPGQTGWTMAQAGFLPSHLVSTPGYLEKDVVDYGAENFKLNSGLYYRINDKVEASLLYNGGWGTSIYTGAQRYSLSNFNIQQIRAQLRGDNFFVRAYTTREFSGDSYIAEFMGVRLNTVRYGSLNGFFTEYANHYQKNLYDQGYRTFDDPATTNFVENDPSAVTIQQMADAHAYARQLLLNDDFPKPGTKAFVKKKNQQFEDAQGRPLTVPNGPLFNDKSLLNQVDGQYDFKNLVTFMDLQVGGTVRQFELVSNGTIFADSTKSIPINEFGAYVQAGYRINPSLKLSGSVRYDKNENFDGQINPRISAVYTFLQNHNIRSSIQTGFRNPTTQGQHIDLDIISSRLLGGLPQYWEHYQLPKYSSTNEVLSYTRKSVEDWRTSIFDGNEDTGLLTEFTEAKYVKPEEVRSFEIGYRGLINQNLMIDVVYYHNRYTDFITQVGVVTAGEIDQDLVDDPNSDFTAADLGDPYYLSMLLGTSDNTFSIYTNQDDIVTTQGMAFEANYNLPGGFLVGGNYNWNDFSGGLSESTLNEFNTPEHKFNLTFGNRSLTDNIGFNLTYRWQDAFYWESSFARGDVPAYSTMDAQINYKLNNLNSILRLGGSNILNKNFYQSLGGPEIGGIYYVSILFDTSMN